MREFFINLSEKLVGVFIVLLGLGVLGTAAAMLFAPVSPYGPPQALASIFMLVGGAIYVILMGGLMYLFFGIYRNTERTNALLEQIANK